MEEGEIKKSYRNGWLLFAGLVAYVLLMTWLAIETNMPDAKRAFDMGAVPFVPGSSVYATGYYEEVDAKDPGDNEVDRDTDGQER